MCECPLAKDLSKIPSLVVNMISEQDRQFSLCLAPDEYILESTDPYTGRLACVPALQRGNRKQPVPLIFGMTFIRSFYTVFDLNHHRIGFARNNKSPMPAGAQCRASVQPIIRRVIWMVSVVMAIVSVCFACHVFWIPKGSGSSCSSRSAVVNPPLPPSVEVPGGVPSERENM